jgi:hypothetical protein
MHKHDGITYMFVVFVLQTLFQLIQIWLRANIAINECLQTKKKVVELLQGLKGFYLCANTVVGE